MSLSRLKVPFHHQETVSRVSDMRGVCGESARGCDRVDERGVYLRERVKQRQSERDCGGDAA